MTARRGLCLAGGARGAVAVSARGPGWLPARQQPTPRSCPSAAAAAPWRGVAGGLRQPRVERETG